MNQEERAHLFKSLHVKGNPVILFNIWDAGSAKAVQDSGAKAIATGSWSVAAAHGYEDGEEIPLEMVITNAERICASVTIPVTIDFEGGYAKLPAELRQNVTKVIEAGAVGINFEDQIVGEEGLYSIKEQCSRIKGVHSATIRTGIPIYINARTDIFLKADPSQHNESHLQEAIERSKAYADAGASGFFAPGLRNETFVEKLCESSPLPVNILVMPDVPSSKRLAELGVARISYGPRPYRMMIEALKEAAKKALSLT
jgi:2-methylisocitrate lyase-like PEP mutase family enzyme